MIIRPLCGKKLIAGIAGTIVSIYATVVLACSCISEDFLSSARDPKALSGSISAQTADDTVEPICQRVQEHIGSSSPASNQSNLIAEVSCLSAQVYEGALLQRSCLEGFRPPGAEFAHPDIESHLNCILRI